MAEPLPSLEKELARATEGLRLLRRDFALVGGLAVSIRGEVRFTRDIDLAVDTSSDRDAERLAADLAASGYEIAALVEHEERGRLATVRLRSPARIYVDLLVASSGIEHEIVRTASPVDFPGIGPLAVARSEELLSTKVLAMSDARPQDSIDARGIILATSAIDLALVRERLELIRSRGFDRGEDLQAKLERVIRSASLSSDAS